MFTCIEFKMTSNKAAYADFENTGYPLLINDLNQLNVQGNLLTQGIAVCKGDEEL